MSDKFDGSFAQVNVQFPIETVIEPMAGENYSRALIFLPVSLASTYLPGVSSPTAGTLISLDSSSYGTITGGLLRTWLIPFFTSASAVDVGCAIYDDAEEATANKLADVYTKFKFYAYFKFGIAGNTEYNALQAALCNLCATDTLYSRLWVGTSDSNVLTSTSALVTALNNTSGTYRLIYNPDTDINPALAQLGKTLGTANSTGTPIGNDVDTVAFKTIGASGADDEDGNPTNLTATQKAALDAQNIGYNTYVGDGTGNVITEGSLYSDGSSVGAEWVKSYIEYMCKVNTASYLSRMNKFRNNATYQGIILILSNIVNQFVTLGRLDGFTITAPVFSDLPKSGDTITVPNAWNATYIDTVREVTVYGTLYLTQPTR